MASRNHTIHEPTEGKLLPLIRVLNEHLEKRNAHLTACFHLQPLVCLSQDEATQSVNPLLRTAHK